MKQQMRECMSALLDNEAGDLDLQRVLNKLDEDSDATHTWKRYQLLSSAMRGELNEFSNVDLSARIRQDLQSDDECHTSSSRLGTWWKPVASVAVAASVTAVILTTTQIFTSVGGESTPATALAVNGNVSPVLGNGQAVGFGRSTPQALQAQAIVPQEQILADEMAQRRLDAYLRNHVENAALNTSSGLMPFARAASLQER